MMEKVQRFGGAMFTPVLLFSFSGIMVALCIIFKNPMLVGSIATEGSTWYNIWTIIENGAWTVFNQMELLFVIGLPIGLAKKPMHERQWKPLSSILLVIILFLA